jgi:hypothetical protein
MILFMSLTIYNKHITNDNSEIEKIPVVSKLFKLAHSETVSLVQLIGSSWNQIEDNLYLMYLGNKFKNNELDN